MKTDFKTRVERAVTASLSFESDTQCPPMLLEAMRHAVLSGGGRVRPMLCMAVAAAEGGAEPALVDAAAVAVELLHCASLVHDDLPCFDDATMRRGQPTVHRRFGEPMAVLVGDALIVRAFELVARAPTAHPQRMALIMREIAAGVGAPGGIVAGQAWESEPNVELTAYHRAKTAALFESAVAAGAAAVGADPDRWRALGTRLGEAYQVADDLADVLSSPDLMGKPTGQDTSLHRPSAVGELGVDGAICRMNQLIEDTVAAVPPCAGRNELIKLVESIATRLFSSAPPALAAAI
ncbi:MAG: polyprenyl synthetase family protein [Bradymonadia bacterium]